MSDLIKREDAIKALYKYSFVSKGVIEREINVIPSAEITHDDVMQYCNSRLLVLATKEFIKHQYRIGYKDGKASADRWILCSERLPKDYKKVLISLEWKSVDIGWVRNGTWMSDYVNDYEDDVVAWMPLPEPWKGADYEVR